MGFSPNINTGGEVYSQQGSGAPLGGAQPFGGEKKISHGAVDRRETPQAWVSSPTHHSFFKKWPRGPSQMGVINLQLRDRSNLWTQGAWRIALTMVYHTGTTGTWVPGTWYDLSILYTIVQCLAVCH